MSDTAGWEDNCGDPSSETQKADGLSKPHWPSSRPSKSAKLLENVLQQNRGVNQERGSPETQETGMILMGRQQRESPVTMCSRPRPGQDARECNSAGGRSPRGKDHCQVLTLYNVCDIVLRFVDIVDRKGKMHKEPKNSKQNF